jgi:hypothetical protein
MTTRKYLQTRVIRFYRYSFPFALFIVALSIVRGYSTMLNGLFAVLIAAFLATYIVFMRRIPCLRCSAPLRNVALNWGAKREPAPRCANCGLGIDEEVDRPL